MSEDDVVRNDLRNLIMAMICAISLTIYSFIMVIGGIGSFVEGYGREKVPGWDNWFVDLAVWFSAFVPSISGMAYVVLTFLIIAGAVTADLYVSIKAFKYKTT